MVWQARGAREAGVGVAETEARRTERLRMDLYCIVGIGVN